jgi:hypothetical protein
LPWQVLGSEHAKVRGGLLALRFSSRDRVLISIGFILVGLAMISGAAAMVWTTGRRQRRAAIAAQPAEEPRRVLLTPPG